MNSVKTAKSLIVAAAGLSFLFSGLPLVSRE